MKNKFSPTIFIIFFLFISACGYGKLNVANKNNINIDSITVTGDKRLGYSIKNNLMLLSSNNGKAKLDINLKAKKTKSIKEKNDVNKITKYNIVTSVKLTSRDNVFEKNLSKNFEQTLDYRVGNNHSDTLRNEKKATENSIDLMTDKIANYLIIYYSKQ